MAKQLTLQQVGYDLNALSLTVIEHSFFEGDSRWNYPHTISPYNRIYFILGSDAYVRQGQNRYPLRPGQLYLIPADQEFDYICKSYIKQYYIHFNLELLPGIDLFSKASQIYEMPYKEEQLKAFRRCARENSLEAVIYQKALIWNIIHELISHFPELLDISRSYVGYFNQQRVLSFITEHLSANLRVGMIAQELGLPVHRLSRDFYKDTGQGLKEYIERMLLKRSQNMLLYSEDAISEVSEQLGFSDPFYFSRFFKKWCGIPPRLYRQKNLSINESRYCKIIKKRV